MPTETIEPSALPRLIEELHRILEEERSVLLSGSPDQITEVSRRKLALMERIERQASAAGAAKPSRETLAMLARYNRENYVICTAMLRRMTAALDRLRQQSPHRSYGPDGVEQNPPSGNVLGDA